MNAANQLVVIPLEQLIAILEDFFNRFRDEQNAPYTSLHSEGSVTKVYTRYEVATILKKCPNTITKYIKQRKLHATPLNGQYIINEKDLVKFINNNQKK